MIKYVGEVGLFKIEYKKLMFVFITWLINYFLHIFDNVSSGSDLQLTSPHSIGISTLYDFLKYYIN